MTLTIDPVDLSTIITARVMDVPGIAAVYATRPLEAALRTVIGAVRGDRIVPLVTVSQRDDAIMVVISIGTLADEPAGAIGLRVHAAVDSLLAAHTPGLPHTIRITIGSVTE